LEHLLIALSTVGK